MRPVRRLMSKLDLVETTHQQQHGVGRHIAAAIGPHEVKQRTLDLDPIKMEDLKEAFESTKPSTQFLSEKYTKWEDNHGST